MESKLTIIEIRYIRSLAAIKTDEELADMIDKPVELIKAQFDLMADLPRRPGEKIILDTILTKSEQIKVRKQLPKAPKKKKVRSSKSKTKPRKVKKAEKKKQVDIVQEKVLNRQKDWKKKNEKSQFKTRVIDLKGKVAYKLNSKTTVFALPGSDITELKKKYRIS